MEPPWTELERSTVAAALGEATVPVAIAAMCDAMSVCGIPCALLDAGAATIVPDTAAESGVHVAVRRPDEGLAFLVLHRNHGFTTKDLARVVRLFELVLRAAQPSPTALALHRLRNRLAGVLGNIEFVEMVVAELTQIDQRQEILSALRHARRSCRDVASALHSGEQKNTEENDDA